LTASLESSNNPSQIDWRYFGAVSPVKS